MTDKPKVRRIIILAATRRRALAIADRLRIEHHLVLWPRSVADLAGYEELPVYADWSVWTHPEGDRLADYFAARTGGLAAWEAVALALAASPSKALN